jgi:hypothetical protein
VQAQTQTLCKEVLASLVLGAAHRAVLLPCWWPIAAGVTHEAAIGVMFSSLHYDCSVVHAVPPLSGSAHKPVTRIERMRTSTRPAH